MITDAELKRARDIHREGRIGEAIPVYERILVQNPEHPEALHLLGVAKLQTGHSQEALGLLQRAVAGAPDHAKVVNNLGNALLALQRAADAETQFRLAITLDPDFADAWFNLGNALLSQRRTAEAKEAYEQALKVDPSHAGASNNLGTIHKGDGELSAALELYRNALRSAPHSVEFRSNLVAVLETLNRVDEAETEAAELLRIAPNLAFARLMRARLDRRAGRLEAARNEIRVALDSAPVPAVQAALYFELAHVLDAMGDYAGAFGACEMANETRAALSDRAQWDLAYFPALVEQQRAWFTAERMASIPAPPGSDAGGPVFFVGFPRSGTTLMERILGSHAGLVTTGERSPLERVLRDAASHSGRTIALPRELATLSVQEIERLRRGFFEIAEQVTGEPIGSRTLLDKMPLNIIRLGIGNWLFPDGRAVIALRDPRDVVLSCYMQNFNLNNMAMQQFTNLERTAQFYATVMGLWLQFRGILTIPWCEYRYEDLVADFEGTVGTVLEFLGLTWDDAVRRFAHREVTIPVNTPSYAAITQPVYRRSAGRWRNYEKELSPILPILEPFVKAFGYDPS